MTKLKALLGLALRLFLVFFVTVTFFIGYNRFLVDYTIKDLKLALNSIKKNELDGVDKILSYTLSDELRKPKPEIYTTIALEYSKEILSNRGKERSLKDTETVLEDLIMQKTEKRGRILKILGDASTGMAHALNIDNKVDKRLSEKEKTKQPEVDYEKIKKKSLILRKYSSAIEEREKGNFKNAVKVYLDLAKENDESPIAPLLLYQAGSTYLYDLDDEERAYRIFRLIKMYYPTSYFAYADEEKALPAWTKILPMKILKRVISDAAAKFAQIMVMYTQDHMKREEGDIWSVKPSDDQVAKATENFINKLLKKIRSPLTVEKAKITFLAGNKVEVIGEGRIARFKIKGYLLGKMSLIDGWAKYEVEEAQILGVEIKPILVNQALSESHRVFNRDLPFALDEMIIDTTTKPAFSFWKGPLKDKEKMILQGTETMPTGMWRR